MAADSATLVPVFDRMRQALEKVVVGQSSIIDALLTALVTGGHVILEGVPGTGKTLMVKAMAKLIQADFRRIQLTPDVLPADILGTHIFDLNSRSFTLQKGPVFTQVLLADEINRTPPKTQAALLEAMEEQQVTLEGQTLLLSDLFWVVSTQNSLEFEGTYPLPEAQLDRFLFKLEVHYPAAAAEKQLLLNTQAGFEDRKLSQAQIKPIATVDQILEARQAARATRVEDALMNYLLELVQRSRQHADVILGCSPRCAVAWLQASKVHAWLAGREFVTPDDVKAVGPPLLRHRLILRPDAQLDGLETDTVIAGLLSQVAVPR